MNIWIHNNPNTPKNRNREKIYEVVPDHLPGNMPIAHTTNKGKRWVGRLIKPKSK